MTLTLVLGPAASGKTQALVERAAARYALDPFAATLVLVPTSRHADQFRRRLVNVVGAAFGLEVATLAGWARGTATAAGGRIASRALTEALVQRAITACVEDGTAAEFTPIAATRGLRGQFVEAIDELAAESVAGEVVAAARLPELQPFAAVYGRFAALMTAAGLSHPAGAAAMAAGAVAEGGASVPPLVLVDGFDYLREGELRLVAALAGVAEVVVALGPGASARAARVHARLTELVAPIAVERATRPAGAPAEVAFSAADRDAELRAIARDIKERLTADRSLRPSDFALAFRQVTPILPLARQIFREYDLPLDAAAGSALGALPFGTWVRRLLHLGTEGWRLRDLIAVLRSDVVQRSRWGLHRGHVAAIAEQGRKKRLWTGLDALRLLATGLAQDADETRKAAGAGLARLLDQLAPLLDGAQVETAGRFAATLEGALFGPGAIVRSSADGRAQTEAFRGLLRSRQATDEAIGGTPAPFAAFVTGLLDNMERPSLALREAGGVALAPLHTLHGLRFRYLAIGGLVQGEFPAPRRAPGLLGDEARALLPLPASPRATEEELFLTARSRADAVQVLTRPRIDSAGRPRAASHFFAATGRAAVEPWLVAPERSASLPELALAIVHRWPGGERRRPAFGTWETVRLAARVEAERRSFLPAGLYEGQLPAGSAPALTGPEVEWSASRLESYVTCSFQYFATYGLRLRELDQELQQADPAIIGTVVHKIVEGAVRPLVEAGRPLVPETLPAVAGWVREQGRAMWEAAPVTHGFGRAGLWRLRWPRVRERIERMLGDEAAASSALGVTRVLGVEYAFETELDLTSGPLRFTGKADRVDIADDVAVIVDYKSGRPIARGDVQSGERLQLQLYASALQAQEPGVERVVSRFAYLRPTAPKDRAEVDTAADSGVIATALQRADAVRELVASGRFEVRPGPFLDAGTKRDCPTYCPFNRVCRVTARSGWKQWA